MKTAIATATAIHSYTGNRTAAFLVPFKTSRRGVRVTRFRWVVDSVANPGWAGFSDGFACNGHATPEKAFAAATRSPYLENPVSL